MHTKIMSILIEIETENLIGTRHSTAEKLRREKRKKVVRKRKYKRKKTKRKLEVL